MTRWASLVLLLVLPAGAWGEPVEISGRYPHLAMFNHNGECGTGAVVPWADRLWVITYSPHRLEGSDDKLYEIDAELNRVTREESVGGTPANRLIHRESNQLFIGPYAIDAERNVRVMSPSKMPGRLTAAARHLTDPANKLYIFTMEGTLYEVDVHSLAFKTLFVRPVPGWHGKGMYSSQGRLVVANNGEWHAGGIKSNYLVGADSKHPDEAGALAEWDGETWKIVERRQFTDVTGPGGIHGQPNDESPLWTMGWDRKSVQLKMLDGGEWTTYRLPKADYSYDGTHGWHTEWPRIREVTDGHLLMNIHGQWLEMPRTFAANNTGGLRPIGSYLKITGDFAPWNGRIVFGCDDLAQSEFRATKPKYKQLPRQSQSNLWFTTWDNLAQCGRPAGYGGPWVGDNVQKGEASPPYLFAGYDQRVLHLAHQSPRPVTFLVEVDSDGRGVWTRYERLTVPAEGYAYHVFPHNVKAQWVRLTPESDAAKVTAYLHYGPAGGVATDRGLFASVADAGEKRPHSIGRLHARAGDTGTLLFTTQTVDADGEVSAAQQLELGLDLKFRTTDVEVPAEKQDPGDEVQVSVDAASVVVHEGDKRYRLPKSHAAYDSPAAHDAPRVVREVVTERSLLNAHGTFYVLPRKNSGGMAHTKPICTHDKQISDYCSWRGLLVLAGNLVASPDGHYVANDDNTAGVWLGDIDDLWKLGKPRGQGGPWLNKPVKANAASDPYLMTGYDQKRITLSHDQAQPVRFTIEVDVTANNEWSAYQTLEVAPGATVEHAFPAGYSAHWLRLRANQPCRATAQLRYE